MSMGTLGKATTAARGMGRSMRESGDVGRANETLETYKAQLQELEHDVEAEESPASRPGPRRRARPFTAIEVRPKKTHVAPERVVLVMAQERIEIPCVVGGEEIRTGRTVDVAMPCDHGHVLAKAHLATPEVVGRAAETASKAQRSGRRRGPSARACS